MYQKRPIAIDVDPEFDVFRRLDRNETPPSLSQVFGSEQVTIILPSEEEKSRLTAYEKLAQSWASTEPEKIQIVRDKDLNTIPGNRSIWLFGRSNKFSQTIMKALSDYDITFSENQYQIGNSIAYPEKNSNPF